jgi:Xaa-Pro aminopeptidase
MSMLVQPEFGAFSLGEMERRHRKARELMSDAGIDALFLSQDENVQYFAGTSPSMTLNFSLTRPYMLIVPANAPPVAITMGRGNLLASGYVKDVRGYKELLSFPLATVVNVLKELGLEKSRIGFELGHEQRMGIPVGAFLEIRESLPAMKAVDAGSLLIRTRIIKSPEEVALMRQAAEITGRARQWLFKHEKLKHGITEREIDRLMRQLILEEGGDRTSFVILQDNNKPGASNPFKTDRRLNRGDILAIDTGAYCGMYTIDYPRMAILGKATDEHKHVYRAVLEVNRKMTEALRPGITCAQLFDVCMKAIDDAGVEIDDPSRIDGGRMGHGMGMIITEPPSIMPGDNTVLEPGMIISTEPGVRLGNIQFLYEDVHVVTESGSDRLTQESDTLHERIDF